MHYHLPSHVLFFELIGIPYLYESVLKKNEPVTDSMYYCVKHVTRVSQNLFVNILL